MKKETELNPTKLNYYSSQLFSATKTEVKLHTPY